MEIFSKTTNQTVVVTNCRE